ncbi:hypothetical protein [Brevundimonas bacteroides]|uniref:hypothetical protein n=1 Tax=Brevundimonas bacteroides TaxID=74311 RepID=UPI000A7309D4|nr:hypothetical protein [Brevundimonas bacteroides]
MKTLWTILLRFWTSTPPRDETERRQDRKALAIMLLLSDACLMVAIVIWMTWIEPL